MKAAQKIFSPILIATVLSVAAHGIALTWLSGVEMPFQASGGVITASLETAPPEASRATKAVPRFRRESADREEGTKRAPLKAAETAVTRETEAVEAVSEAPAASSGGGAAVEEGGANGGTGTSGTLAESPAPAGDGEDAAPFSSLASERLDFDLYWLGIYVGNAVLEAANEDGVLRITSQASSAPVISAFYKVEDRAESVIVGGMPAYFRIHQREGKYRSNKETIFDSVDRKVTYFNHLKETKTEHPLPNSTVWDVISGFFFLRTVPLEVGKAVTLEVFDSNKFLSVEVDVLGKERLSLSEKIEADTVIVRPKLRSEGLFQKKGDILIWLTDDEKRIPVKVETEVPVGKVVARLKGFGG